MTQQTVSTSTRNSASPSADVRNAYAHLGDNLELLVALARLSVRMFEDLPEDDFFVQKTDGLREPLRMYLEDYDDSPAESFHSAVPISTPGSKRALLPFAATAAGLLFQLGHMGVGIALVDSDGRGVIFQYRGSISVVAREVTELPPAGGIA